jgi:hypothetical protein
MRKTVQWVSVPPSSWVSKNFAARIASVILSP